MTLSPQDWHSRFRQQAGWTEQLRRYLLSRLNLGPASQILEVGCGTGVITSSIGQVVPSRIYGLDHNLAFLGLAQGNNPATRFTAGDALRLPFPDGAFNAVACHYFLLWIPRPDQALAEMKRVTRQGGSVIAFAEPDYGGRIDYPEELAELGRLQAASLRQQGADPNMGRKLSGLFHGAGLRDVETGVLGGQWQGPPSSQMIESEWLTLKADLGGLYSDTKLDELHRLEASAWQTGSRTLFVPTFYAFGFKASPS